MGYVCMRGGMGYEGMMEYEIDSMVSLYIYDGECD